MAQNTIWRLPYSSQQLSDATDNQVPRISSTTGNWECWDIATSDWVDTGVPAAGKNPYIGSDNYWYVWDSATNQYVKTDYSVAQTSIQSVNGLFADVGGNVALPWTSFTGANPISKGGTGQTTAPEGLRALIDGCSALTDSGIASGDYVPVEDTSDSTNAKKITIENLTNYIHNQFGVAKIQSGTYVGTGTYGVDNPNSITCNFAPKIVFCTNSQLALSNYHFTVSGTTHFAYGMLLTSMLTTEYQFGGFTEYVHGSATANIYVKKSSDGKTIYWYGNVASNQNNSNGITYHWLAIG